MRINTNKLAGMAWFSARTNVAAKDATHTYAHRLYEGYTGRGLSVPFAAVAHQRAIPYIGKGPFWLSVLTTNTPAVRTYEEIGYKTVAVQQDRRIMMRDERQQ